MAENPQMERRQGLRFDRQINLGHVLTILAVGVGLVGSYYQLDGRVKQNAKSTVELRQAFESLANQVEQDRAFHINQRERTWKQFKEFESEIVILRERVSEIKAGQAHIIRQQERILGLLDKFRGDK